MSRSRLNFCSYRTLDSSAVMCDLCVDAVAVTWVGHRLDVYTEKQIVKSRKLCVNGRIINLHFTANCVYLRINWKLTIDFVLSGRLAIGGAISSSSELRGECVWFKLCMPWLFCMEIDVGIVWLLWMGCSTTWPTCECVSLSVGVLLGLELLTRLNEEPIDEARRECVKYYSRVLNLLKSEAANNSS